MRGRLLTACDIGRIRSLASAGRSVAYIAAMIGCGETTVWRRAGDIFRARKIAARRRLLDTYDQVGWGAREPGVTRFGLASPKSLRNRASQIRVAQRRAENA